MLTALPIFRDRRNESELPTLAKFKIDVLSSVLIKPSTVIFDVHTTVCITDNWHIDPICNKLYREILLPSLAHPLHERLLPIFAKRNKLHLCADVETILKDIQEPRLAKDKMLALDEAFKAERTDSVDPTVINVITEAASDSFAADRTDRLLPHIPNCATDKLAESRLTPRIEKVEDTPNSSITESLKSDPPI
jgi:hypothetical protein